MNLYAPHLANLGKTDHLTKITNISDIAGAWEVQISHFWKQFVVKKIRSLHQKRETLENISKNDNLRIVSWKV